MLLRMATGTIILSRKLWLPADTEAGIHGSMNLTYKVYHCCWWKLLFPDHCFSTKHHAVFPAFIICTQTISVAVHSACEGRRGQVTLLVAKTGFSVFTAFVLSPPSPLWVHEVRMSLQVQATSGAALT